MSEGGAQAGIARRLLREHWRTALLVCGVLAVFSIVRSLGVVTIGRVLLSAGIFLPLMVLIEATWMGLDVFVLRALLGERARDAPWTAYVRSGLTAYAIGVFFPMGRVSAEVTRAAALSPYLGVSRVARASVELHGVSMLGTTLISLCALLAAIARLGASHRLVLAIGASSILTGVLGVVLVFGARSPRLWAFLRKHIKALAQLEDAAGHPPSRWGLAIGLSFLGRWIQCLLFATALYAAAGIPSLRTGLLAQGVSLAGSTFGDAVPQQVGVAEGAFYYFAGALGLRDEPAKAVAIAILVRICQLGLAVSCLLVGVVWKERSRA